MHQEGHEVGNHTWGHPDLTRLSPSEIHAQLEMTQAAVVAAGLPAPTLLRPPYGVVNDMVRSHVGLTIVRWNVDPGDWRSSDPSKIQADIVAQAKPGGVMLLHDRRPSTADAIGPAIQSLKPRYQFVTVSELFGLTPGDQGQFFGR
jgi:peptidoglycan/xylan/chitin deacetylase (PgdA/CDA1 family)